MDAAAARVVKVGGSLFDDAQLPRRLQAWLDAQPPAANVLIAGGGKLAESIREMDRLHALGASPAHWLSVRAMGIMARLLVDLLPNAALVDEVADARRFIAARGAGLCVFDPMPLLTTDEPRLPGTPLPHGWDVTSDSIAARVAEILTARELVLLKSDLPPGESLDEAAAAGYVDQFFPTIAGKLPLVRCVNLRGEQMSQGRLV